MSKLILYTIILICQLIFSATPLFAKIALKEFDPFTLAIIRFGTSALLLNLFLLIQGKSIIPPKKYWGIVIFMGFLAFPGNQGLFLYGLQFTSPGHSALLYSATPLFALLLAAFLLKEKLTNFKIAGMLLAFGGVLIVLLDKNITTEPDFVFGDILIIFAVITWALFTVKGKQLVEDLGPVLAMTSTMTVGAIIFVPIGGYNAIHFDYSQISSTAWFSLAFITIATSSIAYPLWYWSLKHMEASKLVVFIFLQPILVSILSYFFLTEELTANFIGGGLIVIVGVILTLQSKKSNRPPATHPPLQSGKF